MRGHVLLVLILVPAAAVFAQDSVRASVSSGVFSGSAHFGAAPPGQRSQAVAGAPYSAEELNDVTAYIQTTLQKAQQPAL